MSTTETIEPIRIAAPASPGALRTWGLGAARVAGWNVGAVVPAHAAWVAGARAQWSELRRESANGGEMRCVALARGSVGRGERGRGAGLGDHFIRGRVSGERGNEEWLM